MQGMWHSVCVNTLHMDKISIGSEQAVYSTAYIGFGRVGIRQKTPITRGLRLYQKVKIRF